MNPSHPEFRLIDLRQDFQPAVLDQFIALYNRTFTDASEMEDPSEWAGRLRETEVQAPHPVSQIMVVVKNGGAPEVLGGAVFEYYQESRCALISYLAVDHAARGKGIGRLMVNAAIAKLEAEAKARGETLRGVFAETANPEEVGPEHDSMPALDRVRALAALGAMRVDVPYVQPALTPGGRPAYHLMLLSFGEPGRSYIDRLVVTEFLHELYRALEIPVPEWNLDFLRTMRAMAGNDQVPLKPLI